MNNCTFVCCMILRGKCSAYLILISQHARVISLTAIHVTCVQQENINVMGGENTFIKLHAM
jgi:hypothetical protein